MTTSKERENAIAQLRGYCTGCRPEGSDVLHINWVGGKPTSTGRSDYHTAQLWSIYDGRPFPSLELSTLVHRCIGGRFNESRGAITMTGCGYNKPHELAHRLAQLVGHPLTVVGTWQGTATHD
jgi:hypothetical protein